MNVEKAIIKLQSDLLCDLDAAQDLIKKIENFDERLAPSVEKWLEDVEDEFQLAGYTIADVMKADNCSRIQALLRINMFIDNEERFVQYMAHLRIKE